jgi:hypothetical protein
MTFHAKRHSCGPAERASRCAKINSPDLMLPLSTDWAGGHAAPEPSRTKGLDSPLLSKMPPGDRRSAVSP